MLLNVFCKYFSVSQFFGSVIVTAWTSNLLIYLDISFFLLLDYLHYKLFSSNMNFWTSVSSVAQSCPTLCNLVDCSTPGFPVHHQFLELAQTHVNKVGDAIQPSHPLSSPRVPRRSTVGQERQIYTQNVSTPVRTSLCSLQDGRGSV